MQRFVRFMISIAALLIAVVVMATWLSTQSHAAEIDASPLVPLVNSLIEVAASILSVVIPILSMYLISWIRAHTKLKNEQALDIVKSQLNALAERIVTYDAAKLKGLVPDKIKINVQDERVATLANYLITQAPGLLTKVGVDINTPGGQAEIVRVITAKLSAPPTSPTTINVSTSGSTP